MKTFALAALAAAGFLLTTGTADAQFIRGRGTTYVAPSYNYGTGYYTNPAFGYSTPPSYTYPNYGTPYATGGLVTSGYTVAPNTNVFVPASGYSSYYTPTYGTSMYSGYGVYPGSGYTSTYGSSYSGGMYRGTGFFRR